MRVHRHLHQLAVVALLVSKMAMAEEIQEVVPAGSLPYTVAAQKFPCDYLGKEWITYDVRLYPKWVDRKGTLKTFAFKLMNDRKVTTGYKKVCMYKVVDSTLNRYLQALDSRVIAYGPYHIWRSDGLMVESGFYQDNIQVGTRLQYDENGIPSRHTEFASGKLQGVDEYLNVDGKRCQDQYRQGSVFRHTCYFPDSTTVWKDELYTSNGLKHGKAVLNFPDGRPERIEEWRLGKYHGTIREYQMYPDRYFLYSESNFQDGIKTGKTAIWDGEWRRLQ